MTSFLLITLTLTLTLLSGCQCSRSEDKSANPSSGSDLVSRGRAVYVANCIACHSSNPRQSGGLGPDVHGSSKELLIARIVHGNYPEGYTPKRSSQVMRALPHLASDIDALTAYLNAP
jgi:mono/diheme cytochrome c family protein